MQKSALIREKRTLDIAKRMVRKNRRTFPPSIFQLNPIIAPMDIEPDIIELDIVEPIEEPILEPILLMVLKQSETGNPLIENSIEDAMEDIPDIINPVLIAQAEELRKLILLQETIKRFSKKKI